jgi:hypothetical protein
MACEYCRYDRGHHPQCPEADERLALYHCVECDSNIYKGDIYYRLDGEPFCKICVESGRNEAEEDDFYWDDKY